MRKLISLGMNCEVSFQIEKYVEKLYASLFSWAFVMDDDLFLEALNNVDDIFSNEISFHMPTGDMFLDEKYRITFHGRTSKEKLFDENGTIKDRGLYDETVEELKSRLVHLKEKFKEDLVTEDEKIYFKKILIEPDFETWGGKEKLERIINGLSDYFLKNGNAGNVLVVVLERKYNKPEIKELEKNGLFIRCVDFFAPVDNTKDGADNAGWRKIIEEFG
ncbi:MAG: hypothetical protein J5986_07015 [Roseburia sp.]|nr:hypothetical protein [Roseburia sp.]